MKRRLLERSRVGSEAVIRTESIASICPLFYIKKLNLALVPTPTK